MNKTLLLLVILLLAPVSWREEIDTIYQVVYPDNSQLYIERQIHLYYKVYVGTIWFEFDKIDDTCFIDIILKYMGRRVLDTVFYDTLCYPMLIEAFRHGDSNVVYHRVGPYWKIKKPKTSDTTVKGQE